MRTLMKFSRPSFKHRVIATLVGFAITTALVVGALGYWVNESIEQSVWRSVLNAELTYYLGAGSLNPRSGLPAADDLRTYVHPRGTPWPAGTPAALRSLTPGIHEDFTLRSREVCVLVKDTSARRIYLVYDLARVEHGELGASVGSIALVVALLVGMCFIGAWFASRLVEPIEDLSVRISALEPSARGVRVGDHYRDREIAIIAGAFDRYLARLDGFVTREQEFTGIASHELRTPVTIISGALDILDSLPDMPARAKPPLERARRATVNMRHTISSLLDLAREGAPQRIRPTSCRLDDLVLEAVDEHRHLLNGKAIELRTDELEPTEMTVPARLAYIAIANLVRNALQHTVEGAVRIKLEGRRLIIENAASGTWPQDTQARSAPGGHNAGSNGLGLYITRSLCTRFGWTLTVSEPATGIIRAGLDFNGGDPASGSIPLSFGRT